MRRQVDIHICSCDRTSAHWMPGFTSSLDAWIPSLFFSTRVYGVSALCQPLVKLVEIIWEKRQMKLLPLCSSHSCGLCAAWIQPQYIYFYFELCLEALTNSFPMDTQIHNWMGNIVILSMRLACLCKEVSDAESSGPMAWCHQDHVCIFSSCWNFGA